jgi:hypothetical protein
MNELLKFLKIDPAKMSAQACLKRGRFGENHWTTDDKNIVHEGRIGYGGLGDVHQVFTVHTPTTVSKSRCIISSPNEYFPR